MEAENLTVGISLPESGKRVAARVAGELLGARWMRRIKLGISRDPEPERLGCGAMKLKRFAPMKLTVAITSAGLLLHEIVFLALGNRFREPGGYEQLLPAALVLLVAAVVSVIVVTPLLKLALARRPGRAMPLLISTLLVAIFLLQEGSELLMGGETGALEAALSVAAVLPLSLLAGVMASWLMGATYRLARAAVVRALGRHHISRARGVAARSVGPQGLVERATLAPLAFGLARRPPPSRFC